MLFYVEDDVWVIEQKSVCNLTQVSLSFSILNFLLHTSLEWISASVMLLSMHKDSIGSEVWEAAELKRCCFVFCLLLHELDLQFECNGISASVQLDFLGQRHLSDCKKFNNED